MIRNERVFDEEHVPDRLQHRDAECQFLAEAFEPALHGDQPHDVLVHGPHGVGKTVLTRHTFDQLHRRVDVQYAHVDAMGKSTAGIVRATLQELGADPDLNAATEDLCLQLRERVDEPVIVVLDEGDDLPTTDALARLTDVPLLGVVPVVHDPDEWLARVDDKIRDALHGKTLELNRYSVPELADILEPRVRGGLLTTVDRRYLEGIADHAVGQARKGIQTLRAAAKLAGQRNCRVEAVPVDEAHQVALRRIRQANLNSLPFHHNVLYELIRDAGSLEPGELHRRYEEVAEEVYRGRGSVPIGNRQRLHTLEKLESYELIERAESQHDEHRVLDFEVESELIDLSDILVQ